MSSLETMHTRRFTFRLGHAAILMAGLATAGCGSSGILGNSDATGSAGASNSSSSSRSFNDRFMTFLGVPESSKGPVQVSTPTTAADFECPGVDIRTGTSTYTVSTPGIESAAMGLRYQATITQTARECKLAVGTVSMKIGIQGRVILGPAGGPGQVQVPMRLAVVREGPDPKIVVTKLRWFSVTVPTDASNVPFTQIEDEVSFPMPRGNEIDAYVVYIGFDNAATKEPERKKPPTAKKPPAPKRAG